MPIQTYQKWARNNDKKCRRFIGYAENSTARMFRITNRPSILREAGFRLVSGGMFDRCTRRTSERGILKTPKQAVADFLDDREYTEALYYPDGHDPYNLFVWIK